MHEVTPILSIDVECSLSIEHDHELVRISVINALKSLLEKEWFVWTLFEAFVCRYGNLIKCDDDVKVAFIQQL